MNGTKHEKVGLVAASYLIGFTTAFIAFGLGALQESDIAVSPIVTADVTQQSAAAVQGVSVFVNEEGLFVTNNGVDRILTVNKASLTDTGYEDIVLNGLHYDVFGQSVSPDERFVYFCEQLSEIPTECDPFIYELDTDIVHRVLQGGEVFSIEISEHSVTWGSDGLLSVGDFVSSSSDKPWR